MTPQEICDALGAMKLMQPLLNAGLVQRLAHEEPGVESRREVKQVDHKVDIYAAI